MNKGKASSKKTTIKKSGFTLIELLVSITILAVLSLIGMVSFSKVQNSARDARRKTDIDAIAQVYEQKYNFYTQTYSPYQDSDFAGGRYPKDPSTNSDYLINLNTDSGGGYNICADLSSNSRYCRTSSRGSVPGAPPAANACADLSEDQVYPDTAGHRHDMVGCNGAVNFANKNNLCNVGWTACRVSDYLARGGKTTAPTVQRRWLADGGNGGSFFCTDPGVPCNGLCERIGVEDVSGMSTYGSNMAVYSNSCSNLTNNFGYLGYTAKSVNTDGTTCCK